MRRLINFAILALAGLGARSLYSNYKENKQTDAIVKDMDALYEEQNARTAVQ